MKTRKKHFSCIGTIGIGLLIVVSLLVSLANYHDVRADSPLVGYWKFNEGTGSTAIDSSSYGNNGTISGGATYNGTEVAPTGFANSHSLLFDGESGQITVPDNPVLDLTGDMTAMAWAYWNGPKINPAPFNDDHVLFDKSGDTVNYRLIIKQDGQMVFYTEGSGGYADSTTNSIPEGEWALVNFTVEDGTIKLYINGSEVGSGFGGVGTTNDGPLYIGRDAISRFFNGYVDEVRLYNYALSPTEIQEISDGGYGAGNYTMFAGGTGAELDPWQITECEQLQAMGTDSTTLAAYYILTDDIDCAETLGWNSGEGFEPIGTHTNLFIGHLNGNNKIITDLYINRPDSNETVGLFGAIDTGATVSALGLQDVDITGNANTGALAGEVWAADVDGVWSSGSVTGNDNYVGGLVGYHSHYGHIANSSAYADVISDDYYIGGLAGYSGGAIENSYATGDVHGVEGIGGLVGFHNYDGTIQRSYATGDVFGSNTVGGLVGEHYGVIEDSYALGDAATTDWVGGLVGYSEGSIFRSYSIGSVTGTTKVGGLIGEQSSGIVEDSFWDTQTSGQSVSDGGEGKTTAQMKAITTFSDVDWNIEPSTVDLNNGYPFLVWQTGDSTPVWYIFEASEAANVMNLTSPITNKQVTLELDAACAIQTASIAAESVNATQDSGFNYPMGFMNFTANCGTPGYATTVTQYYYGATADNFILRKYNPTSSAYFTISGATIEQTASNGQAVLKVAYQATDGGNLDTDATANGIIVDPVGLAQNVVGAPNTGLGFFMK